MRTALFLNREEFDVLGRGEPFNLHLANGSSVTIQLEPDAVLPRKEEVQRAFIDIRTADDTRAARAAGAGLSCSKCGRSFRNRKALGAHLARAHGEPKKNREPCPDCGKDLHPNAMKKHRVLMHGGPAPKSRRRGKEKWQCEKHGLQFGTEAALDEHMEREHQ